MQNMFANWAANYMISSLLFPTLEFIYLNCEYMKAGEWEEFNLNEINIITTLSLSIANYNKKRQV